MGGRGGAEKVEERRKVERRKMREGRGRGRESMGELKEDEGRKGSG